MKILFFGLVLLSSFSTFASETKNTVLQDLFRHGTYSIKAIDANNQKCGSQLRIQEVKGDIYITNVLVSFKGSFINQGRISTISGEMFGNSWQAYVTVKDSKDSLQITAETYSRGSFGNKSSVGKYTIERTEDGIAFTTDYNYPITCQYEVLAPK
ncbi:MAG: hypothetical protein H7328_12210 [Bdellovibrio sp.]|nr:hypothetical protein [Bdellovibrio sp.]